MTLDCARGSSDSVVLSTQERWDFIHALLEELREAIPHPAHWAFMEPLSPKGQLALWRARAPCMGVVEDCPRERQLLERNLPVKSCYHWELAEGDVLRKRHVADIGARRAFTATVPGSGNVWHFPQGYGGLVYVQRSAVMEWALFLRKLCGPALYHRDDARALNAYAVPPNPHGPGRLVTIENSVFRRSLLSCDPVCL